MFFNLTHLTNLTHLMARTYKDQRKFNQKQQIRSGFVDVFYDEEFFGSHKELMRLKSEKVSKTLKNLSRL